MSSDSAMDTPELSQSGGTGLKINKPDLYHGDRSKLETWITQFDRHFHVEGDRIDDDNKVVLVSTYMRGDAEKWVLPIIRKYMDDSITDKENTHLVENWDTFKIRLRQIFSPFKESVIAEQRIQNLRQTKSAADYTTIFQQYAEQIQWDDTALMRMYKQGLRPTVRAELMRSGITIDNLETLQNESIRLDNELFELALEERTYSHQAPRVPEGARRLKNKGRGTRPNEGRPRNTYYPNNRFPQRDAGMYYSSRPEPMHLDNLNKGKEQKPRNRIAHRTKNEDKSKVECYNCHKIGHFARDCRLKNKVIRQLNVLGQASNEDAEEWTVLHHQTICREEDGQTIVGWREETTDIIEKEQVLTDTAPKSLRQKIREYELEEKARKLKINIPTVVPQNKQHLWFTKQEWEDIRTWHQQGNDNSTNDITNDPKQYKKIWKATEKYYQRLIQEPGSEAETTRRAIRNHPHAAVRQAYQDVKSTIKNKDPFALDRNEQPQRYTTQQGTWENQKETMFARLDLITGTGRVRQLHGKGLLSREQVQGIYDWFQQTDQDQPEHLEQAYQSLQQYQGLVEQEKQQYANHHPQRDGITEKTPHPGKQVCGPWDYDNPEEQDAGKERELTPEELDIHSPPASPKLQRENATLTEPKKSKAICYANNGQALIINADVSPRGTTMQPQEVAQPYRIPMTDRYMRDPRNPKHGLLSWISCYHDYCQIHYSSKVESYFPQNLRRCKHQFYDCPKDTCAEHLFDKRSRQHFPNLSKEDAACNQVLLNGSCQGYTWQFCLQKECRKHKKEKEANGYGENESFLGLTSAPGITPEAATQPIQPDSSSSQ